MAGETKNDDGRVFEFTSELEEVVRAQDCGSLLLILLFGNQALIE